MAQKPPARPSGLIQVEIQTYFASLPPLDTKDRPDLQMLHNDPFVKGCQRSPMRTYTLGTVWLVLQADLDPLRRFLSEPPAWVNSVHLPQKHIRAMVPQKHLFVDMEWSPSARR
jgi:hypothetical protein